MSAISDFKGNALAINDRDIAGNWTLGMVRSMGRVLALHGHAAGKNTGWGTTDTDVHLSQCGIDSIEGLIHEFNEESVFDTFDSNRTTNVELVRANVSCKCGEVENVTISYSTSAGDLISDVLSNNY